MKVVVRANEAGTGTRHGHRHAPPPRRIKQPIYRGAGK
jgi:hypothetical protein